MFNVASNLPYKFAVEIALRAGTVYRLYYVDEATARAAIAKFQADLNDAAKTRVRIVSACEDTALYIADVAAYSLVNAELVLRQKGVERSYRAWFEGEAQTNYYAQEAAANPTPPAPTPTP